MDTNERKKFQIVLGLHHVLIMILRKICCELYMCHKIFLLFTFIVFKHEYSVKMLEK